MTNESGFLSNGKIVLAPDILVFGVSTDPKMLKHL